MPTTCDRRRRPKRATCGRCMPRTGPPGTRPPSDTRLAERGDRAHPRRRDQPVRRRGGADRRPARSMRPRDPPPMRRRSRHALALEPGRRRGRGHRLQSPDARSRTTPDRGDRRAGALDPGRRARRARTSSTGPATSSTPAAARCSGSRTSMPGPRWSRACSRPRGDSSSSRAIRRSGSSMSMTEGRWVATDYDYFGGPEASKGWAPEYIDHLSIDDADQHWKYARAWTLGEVITALLGAGLRLERVAEHPVDWWGGHADVRARGPWARPALVLDRRQGARRAGDQKNVVHHGSSIVRSSRSASMRAPGRCSSSPTRRRRRAGASRRDRPRRARRRRWSGRATVVVGAVGTVRTDVEADPEAPPTASASMTSRTTLPSPT